MKKDKGKQSMKTDELRELMRLKGWSKTKLAAEMELTENAVHRWLSGERDPSGPAIVLVRLWLKEARENHAAKELAHSA